MSTSPSQQLQRLKQRLKDHERLRRNLFKQLDAKRVDIADYIEMLGVDNDPKILTELDNAYKAAGVLRGLIGDELRTILRLKRAIEREEMEETQGTEEEELESVDEEEATEEEELEDKMDVSACVGGKHALDGKEESSSGSQEGSRKR